MITHCVDRFDVKYKLPQIVFTISLAIQMSIVAVGLAVFQLL